MKRAILTVLFSVALVGCNFSDPLLFGGGENNTPNNQNNSNNTTDGDMGDVGDVTDSTLLAELTNVLVNSEPLPTEVSAQTEFTVSADVSLTNSSGCADCNVQVLVAISGGDPACLVDAPAGAAAGSATVVGPMTEGALDLLWAAYEEDDCAAALAVAAGSLPETNSLGQITFTAAPGLTIIATTPAADSLDVPVDTEIRVSFDGPIDPTSVSNRVRLNDEDGVQVQATVSVSGSEILIAPEAPLNEFQTNFTILVSSGVTSGARTLEADFMASFTTRMFVPSAFYAASNEFHGVGFSLGIDAANQAVITSADDAAPAQRFRFVPRDDGWVGYNSAPVAATRALDGGDGTTNASMTPLSATPASGQIWVFTRQASGAFVIQNKRFNTAQSLDGSSLPPANAANPNCVPNSSACPLMQPTTSINRQLWRWRRLP